MKKLYFLLSLSLASSLPALASTSSQDKQAQPTTQSRQSVEEFVGALWYQYAQREYEACLNKSSKLGYEESQELKGKCLSQYNWRKQFAS